MDRDKGTAEVQTVDGSYVDSYITLEAAEASAEDRNKRAESLGIKARYKAIPHK